MVSVTSPRPWAWIGRACLFIIGFIAGIALPIAAFAGNFTISTNSTTAQTLGTGAGQTGTVNAGTSLTVSGSTVAVTISGNTATLNNLGTISQTGTGRVVRDNTGVTGLIINNGSSTNSSALMQSADADVIQMNKSPAGVTLNNYGTLTSLNASAGGSQAVDFAAMLSGTNTVNNYAGGSLLASEADAVRTGVNGTVYNAGTIRATSSTGSSSDGVDLQNNSGAQITNDATGVIEGARHGITGGALDNTVTFTASITNNAGGLIRGNNGSGLNFDGFNNKETITVINHGVISGNGVTGDGDGIDADGLVNLTNTGVIISLNSVGAPGQSEGVTVGGGTIVNSGTIEGLVSYSNPNAIGRGITIAGVDTSGTPEPIYADTTITNNNGGYIYGQSGAGIAIGGAASGHTVTIINNAGATIRGAGTEAVIQTGDDNDTVTNAGSIYHDNAASGGVAISLAGGNDTLNYNGGTITGTIDGGTGTNTLNLGNGIYHTSATQNFQNVNVASGSATLAGIVSGTSLTKGGSGTLALNGTNDYTGGTTVASGKLVVNNLSGSGTGTGSVLVQSGAALGGSGTISGLLTVDGIIAPGNSIGTLTTLSSVVWNGTGANQWAFELAGGLDSDRLVVGADFTKGTGSSFTFDFLNATEQGHYILVDWTGTSNFSASDFSYTNLGSGLTGTFALNGSQLEFTAIPEPSTYAALLGAGTLGFVAWRRRFAAPKNP